jgi:hypothetical protein
MDPLGHWVHWNDEVEPVLSVEVPGGQLLHALVPALLLNVPTGQSMHDWPLTL